jgi:hypothetical protein
MNQIQRFLAFILLAIFMTALMAASITTPAYAQQQVCYDPQTGKQIPCPPVRKKKTPTPVRSTRTPTSTVTPIPSETPTGTPSIVPTDTSVPVANVTKTVSAALVIPVTGGSGSDPVTNIRESPTRPSFFDPGGVNLLGILIGLLTGILIGLLLPAVQKGFGKLLPAVQKSSPQFEGTQGDTPFHKSSAIDFHKLDGMGSDGTNTGNQFVKMAENPFMKEVSPNQFIKGESNPFHKGEVGGNQFHKAENNPFIKGE